MGTRRLTDYVAKAGGVGAVMSMLGRGQSPSTPVPRRIVLISVNSESNEGLPIDQSGAVPGTVDALGAMIFGGLGRFSKETSLVFSDAVEQWRRELRADPRWAAESQADIFSIEIRLTDLDDSTLRTEVLEIPTAFRISEVARKMLRQAADAVWTIRLSSGASWSLFRPRYELSATSAFLHPPTEVCLLAAPHRLAAT